MSPHVVIYIVSENGLLAYATDSSAVIIQNGYNRFKKRYLKLQQRLSETNELSTLKSFQKIGPELVMFSQASHMPSFVYYERLL